MLDDAFKIVLDPIFGTQPAQQIFPIGGVSDSENTWKLIANINA
jgi:hypothetical protein